MDLPKNEKTFTFNCIGNITKRKYDGEFTVKCILSIFDKRELELEMTRLSADTVNPSVMLSSIALLLANLKIRIQKAPSWWEQSNNGLEIFDENVVADLYDKVLEQESKWREELEQLAGESLGNPQKES